MLLFIYQLRKTGQTCDNVQFMAVNYVHITHVYEYFFAAGQTRFVCFLKGESSQLEDETFCNEKCALF